MIVSPFSSQPLDGTVARRRKRDTSEVGKVYLCLRNSDGHRDGGQRWDGLRGGDRSINCQKGQILFADGK